MGYRGIKCFKCGNEIGGALQTKSGDDAFDVLSSHVEGCTYACNECVYKYGFDVYSISTALAKRSISEERLKRSREKIFEDAQKRQDEFEALPMLRFIRWITGTKPKPISVELLGGEKI